MKPPSIRTYFELLKPSSVLLLTYTSIATYLLASRIHSQEILIPTIFTTFIAIAAGSAGCNATTSFIDRDMDVKMSRTKHRPLPSNRIYPPIKGLYIGLALVVLALVLSLTLNIVAFVAMALGIFDNVIVYSLWLKRKNPFNIILGGFSGGVPALFGWTAATNGQITLLPILISMAVVTWIPNHIWNLAIYYKSDYKAVGVPMFPVIVEENVAVRCIASTIPILFLLTIMIGIVGGFGSIYWVSALLFGAILLVGNLYTMLRPTRENLWRMFKFSSPYLAVLFTAMLLDIYL
jgi:protoheme IX farnesyltransferase